MDYRHTWGLHSAVTYKCDGYVWVCEYAKKTEQLHGLEQYLHRHRVKYTYTKPYTV